MSLLNYIFDTEWSQRRDIEELRDAERWRSDRFRSVGNTVESLRDQLDTQVQVTRGMERQLAEQQLVIRALIARLRRHEGWDENAFREEIRELDMQDGRLDRRGPDAPLDA